jgi:hypothetical protein
VAGAEQTPLTQTGAVVPQTMPHAPKLVLLVEVLTQAPAHSVCPGEQFAVIAQRAFKQLPAQQLVPARQAWPTAIHAAASEFPPSATWPPSPTIGDIAEAPKIEKCVVDARTCVAIGMEKVCPAVHRRREDERNTDCALNERRYSAFQGIASDCESAGGSSRNK